VTKVAELAFQNHDLTRGDKRRRAKASVLGGEECSSRVSAVAYARAVILPYHFVLA